MALEIEIPDHLKCFKAKGPQGHYRSAKVLAKAGVWVGHAAPDKHSLSFQGLLSFKELKANWKSLSPPFPPLVAGEASDVARHAVCRACYGETSPILQFREIQVMKRPLTKLTIMPLDMKDEHGALFCILLPQPNNRSLRGLEIFRPYELMEGEFAFTSNFELFSPRNRSFVSTEKEALEVLGLSSEAVAGPTPTPSPTLFKISPEKSLPARAMTKTRLRSGRQRSPSGGFVDPHAHAGDIKRDGWKNESRDRTPRERRPSDSVDAEEPTPNAKPQESPLQLHKLQLRYLQNYPIMHRKRSFEMTGLRSYPVSVRIMPSGSFSSGLSVWMTSSITSPILYDCSTFSNFLDHARNDAADDPRVIEMIDRPSLWRPTYQVPGQTKKAFTLRIGDDGQETGYERLLQPIIQSTFWQVNLADKINVDLRVLR